MWGMDGKATDFVIYNGELVPVEMLYDIEDEAEEAVITVNTANVEEAMQMLLAIRGLAEALRLN